MAPAAGTRLGGRKIGTQDRWNTDARWQLDEVFRLCGGVEAMARWAKENPKEFYPAYIRARVPKPLEVPSEDSQVTIIISPKGERLSQSPTAIPLATDEAGTGQAG